MCQAIVKNNRIMLCDRQNKQYMLSEATSYQFIIILLKSFFIQKYITINKKVNKP